MRYFIVVVSFLVIGLGAFGTWLKRNDDSSSLLLGRQDDSYLLR